MDTVKKLVSGRLKAQTAGPHPDPELLAAYAENGLSGRDRDVVLNHLSACTDCRATLYLAMPEADAQQQVLRPSREPRLAMRWAALAASVVILASVVVTNRGAFTRHASSAPDSAETAPQTVAELKTPVLTGQAAKAKAPAIQAGAKVRAPLKHMTAKPQASMQFDQSGEVRLAAPQSTSVANGAFAARVDSLEKAVSRGDWGLSANGDVQRSLDSGKTWQIVPIASGISFHAISSIGDDIWAGGRAGTLYHSADSGQSWKKAELVSTGDITHIEFADQQNGLLSTANGEIWSTSDGGKNWRLK